MTFISTNTRLLNTVHALYAWVSPSPRVRCLLACVTYLLTNVKHPTKLDTPSLGAWPSE
jgi:hypothetical protein